MYIFIEVIEQMNSLDAISEHRITWTLNNSRFSMTSSMSFHGVIDKMFSAVRLIAFKVDLVSMRNVNLWTN